MWQSIDCFICLHTGYMECPGDVKYVAEYRLFHLSDVLCRVAV